jgi:hypothetical protein
MWGLILIAIGLIGMACVYPFLWLVYLVIGGMMIFTWND